MKRTQSNIERKSRQFDMKDKCEVHLCNVEKTCIVDVNLSQQIEVEM